MDVFVEEATAVTGELVDALGRLVPQLSSSAPPPTAAELEEIVASPTSVLFLARLAGEGVAEGVGSRIAGTLTLVLFRIPTGFRARIEDVVVDSAARGQGVGESLTLAALDRAYDAGARSVDLTSRPSREAAHRLYTRLGFEVRETTVYRHVHPGT